MTGKQLKNSILQWAIQGKLVPQDPNDEPASVLLERIRVEKARLVKEGKIKKDKNESIIFRGEDNSYYEKFADGKVVCIDDEIPFCLPIGWSWCRLKDLYTFIDYRGSTPNKIAAGIPLVTAKNVKSGYIDYSIKDFISDDEYECRKSRGISQKGDILFTTEAPLGNAAIADLKEFSAGQRLITLQAYSNKLIVNTLFLYFILSPIFQEMLLERKTGTTVAGIKASKLKDIPIPVPPLYEQGRIVNHIDNILPLIEKYDIAYNKQDSINKGIKNTLKKSILQEAIQGKLVQQDPNDEPASILLEHIKEEKRRLVNEGKLKKKDLVDSVIYKGDDNKYYETIAGQTNEIDFPYSFPSSWEIVRLQNICSLLDGERKTGRGICLDAKYLRGKSTGDYMRAGKFVHKGDNIILVDGENSGEVFSVPIDGYMGSTFKQLWISKTLYAPYILECIRFYQDELRNSKKGAAIPHLNKDIFKNLFIGIPPFDEQKRIVNKINEIELI